ncbi:MAG: M23 family metallopeptidase, partial [Bacteroidota bacterium]
MRLNFIVVWGVINLCLAQVAYVQEYDPAFISPVDDDIYLAGTFGELRSVHFHAGIDIKTGGRIGKKIRTIEDGYIYRVKVTPGGYGKTVYVKHPNGYISVYAHLHEFIPVIDKEVKHFQYKKQQHHLDLYFKPSRFPVNKGEVIGISGNSGYSLGPHLHFEIRRAADHVPLNALLFNFLVKDDIAPDIKGIGVYPLNDSSYVQGRNKPAYFRTQNNNGDYKLG